MNESYFNGKFDNFHATAIKKLFHPNLKDAYITKKVSDYYFSKLIPDFFYHTPLSNNYYPTIVATRVTISFSFLILFSYYIYTRDLSNDKENPKKYSFNYFSRRYLEYEKELLLFEKSRKNKIILG
jgi:hypothetical protein